MPSSPPTLVSLCLHIHAFCLPQLVVVLPLVIHPLPLQLLGTPPPPFQQCLHLSWLRCLLSCPSLSLVQLPLVWLNCFSHHHLLLLTAPICWHHHLSLCNGLFLLLRPLVPLVPMAGCCVESNRCDYCLVIPIPNIPSHCANCVRQASIQGLAQRILARGKI